MLSHHVVIVVVAVVVVAQLHKKKKKTPFEVIHKNRRRIKTVIKRKSE